MQLSALVREYGTGRERLAVMAKTDPVGAARAKEIVDAVGSPTGFVATRALDTVSGGAKRNLLQDARQFYGGKRPPINGKHLLRGEISRSSGGAGGYHTRLNNPGLVEEISAPTCFGTRDVVAKIEGQIKESTLFPDEWNLLKIHEKIGEAWMSPIKGTESFDGFIGTTKEGLPIRIWLVSCKATGKITINSAFPAHKYMRKVGMLASS